MKLNPITVLSLEGLKKTLSHPSVQNILNKEDIPIHTLASEIMIQSMRYEIIPTDLIQIKARGRRGKQKENELEKLHNIDHRILLVQELLIQNELTYRNNMFARRIDPGSTEYSRLVSWVEQIEETYQLFLKASSVPVGHKAFYQFYLNRAYELIPTKSKISINHFASHVVQTEVGLHLSKWLRVLNDPYKTYTTFMIKEVVKVFALIGEDILQNYEKYDRVRGAVETIMKEFFPEGGEEKAIQRYIEAWVWVSFESYSDYQTTTGSSDIKIALGFVGGNWKEGSNTALERLKAKVRSYKQKKEKQSDHQISEMKMNRKLKSNW